MKTRILLTAAVALGLLAQSAWATISITAMPSAQTVSAGGTFSVTFSLNVTQSTNPANVAGIDLFVEGLLNQNSINISNLFSIQGQNVLISNWSAAGPGNYPDAVNGTNSTHAGFAQNKEDQALSANNLGAVITTPFSIAFETLIFTVSSSAPAGVFNFATTAPTSTVDPRGTHIVNSSGAYFIPDSQASFAITVIPEPATYSLFAIGGAAVAFFGFRRRRLVA